LDRQSDDQYPPFPILLLFQALTPQHRIAGIVLGG